MARWVSKRHILAKYFKAIGFTAKRERVGIKKRGKFQEFLNIGSFRHRKKKISVLGGGKNFPREGKIVFNNGPWGIYVR